MPRCPLCSTERFGLPKLESSPYMRHRRVCAYILNMHSYIFYAAQTHMCVYIIYA